MKPQNLTIVANWKMQLSFNEALSYYSEYHYDFVGLTKKAHNATIVLCPSFTALYPIIHYAKDSGIEFGAQDCSAFRSGPHTGQVCSESISQVGCHYCIIGHSERRQYNKESNKEIAEKTKRLLEQEVMPIICIGETTDQKESQKTFNVLEEQLEPVLECIANFGSSQEQIFVAYEPVWAIGTGNIPSAGYLSDVFGWISEKIDTTIKTPRLGGLLYGGSVSAETAPTFKSIETISGLLVGGASLDFQKFNNIVNLYCDSI